MFYLYVSLAVASAVLIVWGFVWLNNSWLKTTRYNLPVAGLGRGVKIVQVSDLHGKSFGRGNKRLIEKIAAEKPDFIAVTGDVIHLYTTKNISVALSFVEKLCAIAPVLFVAGNHEMRNIGYAGFKKQLIDAGCMVLDDCTADICGLTVVGLNCASLKNDKIFSVTPEKSPKILLAHKPEFAEKYGAAGYDVALCGHAHGGQWRIPFTDTGFYAPGQGLFPQLTSGVHVCKKTRVVISRGLGNSEFPLRLFNRPEIVVVSLQ